MVRRHTAQKKVAVILPFHDVECVLSMLAVSVGSARIKTVADTLAFELRSHLCSLEITL